MGGDVGVGELVEELEQRGARLPFEIGAFVALEACEGLLRQSAKIEPDDVRVTLDGSVVVVGSAEKAEPEEAARSLVSVLARLLVAAGPGVPPELLQLVKEVTTGQRPRGLRDLHDAIEASLIPINRGASRRVLARLVRESDRPGAVKEPEIDPRELDAELDELLRDPLSRVEASIGPAVEALDFEDEPITERIPLPKPSGAETPPLARPEPVNVEPSRVSSPATHRAPPTAQAALAVAKQVPSTRPEPVTRTIRKWNGPAETEVPPVLASTSVPVTEAELETPTESVFSTGSVSPDAQDAAASWAGSSPAAEPGPGRPSRTSVELPKRRSTWGILLFAAGLGLVLYAGLAAGVFDPWLRPEVTAPVATPSGAIRVQVSPSDAQVFLFVGRGPAAAKNMSTGSAHEFLVFDEGLRPVRATVPRDAQWTVTDDGPLYELAVQSEPSTDAAPAFDLGAPKTEPAPTEGPTGTVRVITNPPGAKVYRFVGLGPITQLRVPSIHEGQELLVYAPGYETRRVVIGPSDWKPVQGGNDHEASLAIELPKMPESAPLEPSEE